MSASNRIAAPIFRPGRHQRGSTVVEFALVVLVFLMFVFAVIELARAMFLFNTVYDATRRAATAAAATDFGNPADLARVRQLAIYRDSPGGLVLMPTLTDAAVRIEYLAISRASNGKLTRQVIATAAMPANAAENRRNCTLDPYGSNCAQLVQVRICDPKDATGCTPVMFKPMTSLISLSVALPMAQTIARTQSLGASVH